ncbi:MAG: ABC transporter ATP-binding protein [Chloroflexi bacterium]|nr:ABC transporter ATP-binding protein [Chloroflexota bacterium]
MSFVQINGLRKFFGDTTAAAIDLLEVHEGEFLSLLGPSGCGKTTTLRCIAGILEPDQGFISIRGQDITRVPPYRRNLGMVFQNYALFPHFTIFENVAYGLKNRGIKGDVVKKKVSEALELVELPGIESRFPHQLSGGQQQRVALARAIVYDPDVLLLDEPLSNLDAKLRKSMRFELKRLQRQLKLTTIFVTHDQQEALSLSDKIVVMNAGRVEQVGTPNEIYENPRTLFVADFIGSTNILKGIVRACDAAAKRCRVSLLDSSEVWAWYEEEVAVDSEVDLIVKPEKIRILTDGEKAANSVGGKVLNVAYSGANYNYHVQVAGHSVVEIVGSALDTGGQPVEVEIGADVNLQFDPTQLKVIRRERA